MFQTKVAEKIKTRFVSSNFIKYHAVYDIMWKITVQHSRPQKTMWHKHIACWIPKTTNKHTQVV